tara:strand:- start:197 stop:445 length:249 start_codon:yes stop_codon:yes gene_type:complete
MTLPLKKRMEVINQKLVDEKKLRKYEVEIQIKKTEIYHITAKDDADLIEKDKGGLIQDEGKLVRIDEAEDTMGGWKDISNVK